MSFKMKILNTLIDQLKEVEKALDDIKSNEYRVLTDKEASLELTKANILLAMSNFSDVDEYDLSIWKDSQ